MREEFKFRNFIICQESCAMKVGTDGVMLGAWANGGQHILDIGTGTGVIALMMAQRFPESYIEGVEIDPLAARQAAENVLVSPYADRIGIHVSSLQDFKPHTKFDTIVTNPPFFVNSLASPQSARTVARHATSLTYADIFNFASLWLSPDGELSAVIPVEVVDKFTSEAFVRGFFLARQYLVKTVERRMPRRVLLSFKKSRPETFDSQEVLLMYDGKRSQWYENLTKDFYIK